MSLIKRIDTNRFPINSSNLLDNFLTKDVAHLLGREESIIPSVNIIESRFGYKLEVAAPGMDKENFEIKIENELLYILGKEVASKQSEDNKIIHREFKTSSFQRSFRLTEFIDLDKINAEYKNGILHVYLPKKEEELKKQEVKHIPIL